MEQKLISLHGKIDAVMQRIISFYTYILSINFSVALKISGIVLVLTLPWVLTFVWNNLAASVVECSPIGMDELASLALQSPFLIGGLLFCIAFGIFYPVISAYISIARDVALMFFKKEETK